jgi:hypothetical protein
MNVSVNVSLNDLEALYSSSPLLPLPQGVYRGEYLLQLESPGARTLLARTLDTLAFAWTPFGIDFTSLRWYFFHPRLQAGHFRAEPTRSRWRETEAVRLYYDVSRLPIGTLLYDELKPLRDGRVLGLGGVNGEKGQGDHFFFMLTKA